MPTAPNRQGLSGTAILPDEARPTMGRLAAPLTFAARGSENTDLTQSQAQPRSDEPLIIPPHAPAGELHGVDAFPAADPRMVSIDPGDHLGRGHLHSAVAMVGPRRRRGG